MIYQKPSVDELYPVVTFPQFFLNSDFPFSLQAFQRLGEFSTEKQVVEQRDVEVRRQEK